MNFVKRIFERISHALYITKQSISFLLSHKQLITLPAISALLVGILCAAFIGLVFVLLKTHILAPANDKWLDAIIGIVVLFVFVVLRSFIVTVMQVALTKQVFGFFEEKTIPAGQAFAAAWSRAGTLFSWAVVAGFINLISTKDKNSSSMERYIGGAMRLGWEAISFFVIPILALQNVTLTQTIKQSAQLFKNTFGESVVGVVGFSTLRSIGFFLLVLPIFALPKQFMLFGALIAFVIAFIGSLCISAAEVIFKTALYEYSQGKTVGIFASEYYSKSFISSNKTQK